MGNHGEGKTYSAPAQPVGVSAEITPERIAELRKQYPMVWSRNRDHHPFGHFAYATLDINEVLDALESSRAEVQRLTEEARRSDAGRVEVPKATTGSLLHKDFA